MKIGKLITFLDLEKRGIPNPGQNRKLWLNSQEIADLGIASMPTILKWMRAGKLGEYLYYKNGCYIHVNNIDKAKQNISDMIREEGAGHE